jgi:hypothetical protein
MRASLDRFQSVVTRFLRGSDELPAAKLAYALTVMFIPVIIM